MKAILSAGICTLYAPLTQQHGLMIHWTPLSSQRLFLKGWVHGKFHHRVSREGLGTLEMQVTKT